MRPFKKKPQMTSEEFKTALREAGLGVAQGWIVDVTGKCPGFASLPSFNKGVLNRNPTLSKVLWEREAEIARRAKKEGWMQNRPADSRRPGTLTRCLAAMSSGSQGGCRRAAREDPVTGLRSRANGSGNSPRRHLLIFSVNSPT
jgi:hypothetical protein